MILLGFSSDYRLWGLQPKERSREMGLLVSDNLTELNRSVMAGCLMFARYMRGLLAGLVVCWLLLLFFSAAVFAKVAVDHDAGEKKGYARIVLDFEKLPGYESRVDDTIMVLTFSEPIDLDFSQLVSKLPKPIMLTFPPLVNSWVTISVNAFRKPSASIFETLVRLAIASINSCLFIILSS